MLIEDRIRLIIKANNESSSSFADKIGIKRSNLSHVLSGRNKPSLDFLAKLLNHYPNVNASWLVTGITRDGELQEEHPADELDPKEGDAITKSPIERVMVFYKDGTFKHYLPNEQ